jgi:hypothetical protein
MSKRTRRAHTPAFKAKVALASLGSNSSGGARCRPVARMTVAGSRRALSSMAPTAERIPIGLALR